MTTIFNVFYKNLLEHYRSVIDEYEQKQELQKIFDVANTMKNILKQFGYDHLTYYDEMIELVSDYEKYLLKYNISEKLDKIRIIEADVKLASSGLKISIGKYFPPLSCKFVDCKKNNIEAFDIIKNIISSRLF